MIDSQISKGIARLHSNANNSCRSTTNKKKTTTINIHTYASKDVYKETANTLVANNIIFPYECVYRVI